MKSKILDARLAFESIFVAKPFQNTGEPAYSCTFLISKDNDQYKAIVDQIKQVAKEKWGDGADAILKKLYKEGKVFMQDGDDKVSSDGKPLNGYSGHWAINTRSKSRPGIFDKDKTPLTKESGRPYSGCYVNGVIDIWAQDNGFGKRINATLLGVQFNRHGDAFGGSTPSDGSDFDVVDSDDGDDIF